MKLKNPGTPLIISAMSEQTEELPIHTRDLLKFLREENEAARKAVLDDSEATRRMLRHTLWVVAIPITAAIGMVGFLGIRSFSDIRSGIQQEARTQLEAEVRRMQGEIRNTLADQFKAEHLQQLVRTAARDETVTAARPMIKQEVATQVKSGVAAERGTIQKAVVAQTNSAVAEMNPKINTLVKSAVDAEVSARVAPVVNQTKTLQDQAKALQREQEVALLIGRASADDGQAFDKLYGMWANNGTAGDQEQRKRLKLVLMSILNAHDLGGMYMTREFVQPPSHDQLIKFLSDEDSGTRQAALDHYCEMPKDAGVEPRIFQMALSDESLRVRTAAYRVLNKWENAKLVALETYPLLRWWSSKQSKQPTSGGK